MKISTKTQYGLRILLHVAKNTRAERLAQGKDIAARQNINEQIMVSLKKGGLIQTQRGRNGGYMLARDPHDISVLAVIEVFEGDLALGESEDEANLSGEGRACAWVWQELSTLLRERAADISLASIIERDVPFPDYSI